MDIITRLEEVLLLTIWRLKDNAYGVTINREVSSATSKNYSMGSLYFSLDQLHKKGLVKKMVGDPSPERGGRSKIYYMLTPEGEKRLLQAREHQEALWKNVPKVAFGKGEKK